LENSIHLFGEKKPNSHCRVIGRVREKKTVDSGEQKTGRRRRKGSQEGRGGVARSIVMAAYAITVIVKRENWWRWS